jgi:hypothetical protein
MKILKTTINGKIQHQKLELPIGSKILSIQIHKTQIALWYECDESETEKVNRHIWIFETYETFPKGENFKHLSTVQMNHGALLFHVYEKEAE